jgi:lipopolysaccharide/colanic/teichoic acid biosynthesis glycosyltransferase
VGDSRVTPIGRFLRASHIDELPQLWNVLCGDMSLIGPRPERPEFTPVLEQAIAGYRDRLVIRPGVTGLAQVQLPPDTDLASVQRKLAYDLYYIEHMSPWLDVRVLIGTFAKLAGVPFWAAGRLLAFPRLEELTSRRAECVA